MKEGTVRGFAAIAGLVLLAACAGDIEVTPPKPRQIQNTFPYDRPFDAVWQAAIEAVAEMNLPIANLEKDSGLITIDWQNFGAQNPNDGFCDCGRLKTAPAATAGDWVPGKPVPKVEGPEYETWYVRGHFNIFIKRIGDTSCELKVNSVFETGSRTCISTGRLEAALDKIVRQKVG